MPPKYPPPLAALAGRRRAVFWLWRADLSVKADPVESGGGRRGAGRQDDLATSRKILTPQGLKVNSINYSLLLAIVFNSRRRLVNDLR